MRQDLLYYQQVEEGAVASNEVDSLLGEVVKAMNKPEAVLPDQTLNKRKGSKQSDEQRYIVLASSALEKNNHEEEVKNEAEDNKIKEKWDTQISTVEKQIKDLETKIDHK